MTDVEKAPYGTKRRGSTEMKTEELQIPSDITPNISASSEEPEPSDADADTITAAPDIPSKAPPQKKVTLQQPPSGHRRRNTDGNINFAPSGTKFFKKATSKQVIEMMQSELPPSARLDMQQKANYLKLERELKHAQIKLREAEDQCSTAVEIIGNLQRENEDLAVREEMLRTQLGATSTELKISEQKVQSLEDLYRTETAKYKEEAESTKKQLNELHDDINQKDMQLSQAKEYQRSIQTQLQQQTSVNDQEEYVDKMIAKTKREKQLKKQIEELQQQVIEKDAKMENLLSQVENANVWQHEKDNLQKELNQINAMAQQDIMFQKEQMEKMTRELIMLGSRNSALEKERDDLMNLLEERDYENQMLKTGYGLHRNKTSRNHAQMEQYASQLAGDMDTDAEYDETLENLEFMDQQSYRGDDLEDVMENSEEYENMAARQSRSSSPKHKAMKPQREVVDVVREYLNLTASVVNMKFPRITHISSEELINKVKNYQFFEYHDMMVRIMKTEEQKLVAKQKAEQEAKAQANGANGAQAQQTGMLSRFRNFFGGGSTANNASNGGGGRRRTVDNGTQQSKTLKTRGRNNSAQTERQRGGSTIDKKAPSPPSNFDVNKAKEDVKKRALAFGKKAKDVKDSTVKKITGNPTEKEKDEMADMSFVGVPFVGAPKESDDELNGTDNAAVKPDKPAQKL